MTIQRGKGVVDVVIGLQWGDEGKGAVVDRLCARDNYDIVVRAFGGPNAGHTVVPSDGKVFKLHQIPSGILSGRCCVLGSGMVIDPIGLLREVEELESRGVDTRNLILISDRASWLLPWHRLEDELQEEARGEKKIGTTGRGIGPCYTDHVRRTGLRMCDFARPEYMDILRSKFTEKQQMLRKLYGIKMKDKDLFSRSDLDDLARAHQRFADNSSPCIINVTYFIQHCIGNLQSDLRALFHLLGYAGGEKRVLIEGAQGVMLDARHGTYPYVTSTETGTAACASGAGITPAQIRKVFGVLKAYTTKVGAGPFPSRISDDGIEGWLREKGREKGTTTGRDRDCGWLDLPQLRYAARLNGVTDVVVTKLDVLSGIRRLSYIVQYNTDDKVPADFSNSPGVCFVGQNETWRENIRHCRHRQKLPPAAQNYLGIIEKELAPIDHVAVGPERDHWLR